jgi:hypothetical protein
MTDKYALYEVKNILNPIEDMVIVKAVSHQHAYIKAANILNKPDVVKHRIVRGNNEKWKCSVTSNEIIEKNLEECLLKIEKLRNIQ